MDATTAPRPDDLDAPADAGTPEPAVSPVFGHLLVNTLASGVTTSFLWFALTFWVYLETRSVVATGFIAGAFSISSALLGPVFGTFVDRHRKHASMMLTTTVSASCFALATALFVTIDADSLLRLKGPWFWLLVMSTLLGSVAGQMRGIALSTCVTLLVPESRRDRANGMVGTVTGLSFAITSVFSGLVIGGFGMGWAYYGSLALTLVTLAHLRTIRIDEPEPGADPQPTVAPPTDTPPTGTQPPATGGSDGPVAGGAGKGGWWARHVDVPGALEAIRAVPGLRMLIFLAAFNNLLAGVFMALMDAYGLSLVSVETWGLLWGFISLALIAGGIVVAKRGLGRNPLRVVLVANFLNWTVCSLFALRSSIVLLTIGMVVWLALMPAIEAAEQTVLQRSIPFERQGRVFGFAQLVENAAAPLTTFLMAPIAEAVFMPLMTDGAGADLIGGWFGTGPERGLALMFTIAGLLGVIVTVVAWASRSYRDLAAVASSTEGPSPAPVAP